MISGIAMARVLYDGLVEFEDGTPATTSQMAKDVVEFLNWAAEPEMDNRKKMGLATLVITSALLALSIWIKRYVLLFNSTDSTDNASLLRYKWAPIKTRKIVYNPPVEPRRNPFRGR